MGAEADESVIREEICGCRATGLRPGFGLEGRIGVSMFTAGCLDGPNASLTRSLDSLTARHF